MRGLIDRRAAGWKGTFRNGKSRALMWREDPSVVFLFSIPNLLGFEYINTSGGVRIRGEIHKRFGTGERGRDRKNLFVSRRLREHPAQRSAQPPGDQRRTRARAPVRSKILSGACDGKIN